MGYLMPKPPGMSKEQSDKWDKRQERYYNVMIVLVSIAGFMFAVLLGIVIYVKTFK